MANSPITTPAQAQQILDLSNAQFNNIRNYFGINDYPFQPDRTYIVFDAVSGNNTLHIDIGSSTSYSILKGDGILPTSYTDTGGNKTLNYAVAGRYLITIDGNFNGIDTTGASSEEKGQYIIIIGGINYPTSIVEEAFNDCLNLEYAYLNNITSIGNYAFYGCSLLTNIFLHNVTSIGNYAFNDCFSLINISLYNVTSIGGYAFLGNGKLLMITIKYSAGLTINSNAFLDIQISDLYVRGASNLTQAQSVETKAIAAGMIKLNGYRLLY